MATVKVKFRPSTVADREGTIYYQIIHDRKVRQLLSDYHVFPNEWNENRFYFPFVNASAGMWNV